MVLFTDEEWVIEWSLSWDLNHSNRGSNREGLSWVNSSDIAHHLQHENWCTFFYVLYPPKNTQDFYTDSQNVHLTCSSISMKFFCSRFILPSLVQYLPAKIDGATSMCWMCWLSMADTYRPELWQKRKQSFWFGIRGMVGGFYTSPACLYHLSDSGTKFINIAIWIHNSWPLRNPENQGVLV